MNDTLMISLAIFAGCCVVGFAVVLSAMHLALAIKSQCESEGKQ